MLTQEEQRAEDERWMRVALAQAQLAQEQGEVPVGAVVVAQGKQISTGFNQPISALDATAHAEIVALRQASQALKNYRLPQVTMYVTVEPCTMCVGALVHARINRLVFGAYEKKSGALESHPLGNSDAFNHSIEVVSGVLADECGTLMSEFFALRRQNLKRKL